MNKSSHSEVDGLDQKSVRGRVQEFHIAPVREWRNFSASDVVDVRDPRKAMEKEALIIGHRCETRRSIGLLRESEEALFLTLLQNFSLSFPEQDCATSSA